MKIRLNKKLIGLIILVLAILLIFAIQKNLDITVYKLKANVTELRINNSRLLLSISNDPTEFNFGIIPENLTVKKILNLKNNENFDSIIEISISGNISKYIKLENTNFILKSKKSKQLDVIFNATKIGYYTGEMKIYIITPKYEFLAPLSLWKL